MWCFSLLMDIGITFFFLFVPFEFRSLIFQFMGTCAFFFHQGIKWGSYAEEQIVLSILHGLAQSPTILELNGKIKTRSARRMDLLQEDSNRYDVALAAACILTDPSPICDPLNQYSKVRPGMMKFCWNCDSMTPNHIRSEYSKGAVGCVVSILRSRESFMQTYSLSLSIRCWSSCFQTLVKASLIMSTRQGRILSLPTCGLR